MSLLDTVEPCAHMFPSDLDIFQRKETTATAYSVAVGNPEERSRPLYSRETVESLLSQSRKEALLEAVEVCKTIANDAEDCGATPEMLEIVYAVEDELRRMAEYDKTTMEGEK